MKFTFLKAFLLLGVAVTVPSGFAAEKKTFTWPNGAKAAVNLAYDDALNSQLDNAIPARDKYQLIGSFYLTLASDTIDKRLEDWRAVAANGHELANHAIFHQGPGGIPGRESWVVPHRDLDKMSAAA